MEKISAGEQLGTQHRNEVKKPFISQMGYFNKCELSNTNSCCIELFQYQE